MMRRRPAWSVLVIALLWCPGDIGAEDPEEPPKSLLPRTKWLGERGPSDPRPYEHVLLGTGLLNREYFDWKNQLWIEEGISFGGYVSSNVQWGSEGGPSHSISETLLLFTWEPVRGDKSAGRLVAGFAHDRTFGRPTTREFADTQNLVETPNDLDTHPDLTFSTLGLLHWEQEWWTGPDRGWGLRAGQIYAPSYFGPARYLDDDRRFFMARPLAAAGGAQWVGSNDIGLGANGIAWKDPFYVAVAFVDAKANRQYPDFASFFDGQYLYLGEIGFERDVDGPNEAALRLTVSHLDLDDGDGPEAGPGQSVMLSGDKHFNGRCALAGRWSRSLDRLSADYRELFSLGVLLLVPFSRTQDIAGFGVFTGEPSEADRGWESGAEIFYRLRLTQAVGLMPDIQYWSRDDRDGENARTWVFGLRMEFEF
ncbi:MAG: carbohydrate porin [Deltaproteobacteria bacterium]|jgi:hypothetical protein|nr:carbohydrate porin [Deltaproteobacteria bacterium]